MQTMLPRQVIDVAVSVIDQTTAINGISDPGNRAVPHVLESESSVRLVRERIPNLAFPDVPNSPVESVEKFCAHTVRVKPTRAEFTMAGEKICTQFTPSSFVG